MRAIARVVFAAGVVLALVAGSPASAQNAGVAQQPARRIIPLVPVRALLETSLDTRDAKPGDPVRAKLQAKAQIPNGPALRKNAVLLGHVDRVQASERHGDSSLVLTFDQAELRKGETLPIKVTVMAIAPPAVSAMADESPDATPGGGGSGYRQVPMPQQSAVPADQRAQPTGLPAAQNLQPRSQSQAQALPGVTLQSDISQTVSATLLGQRRNVHMPSGTQMLVVVGVIPKDTRQP